jgi:hypothetical protein
MFDLEHCMNNDYWRVVIYSDINEILSSLDLSGTGVEFGGANGVIQKMIPGVKFENRDFPAYDAVNPKSWEHNWDVVILDQVLEHTTRPWEVFDLIGKHTNKVAIVTVPFLVYLHPYPIDYWRFSKECIASLAEPYFNNIKTGSWGNKVANAWCANSGLTPQPLVSCGEMEEALKVNDENQPLLVWGIFQK